MLALGNYLNVRPITNLISIKHYAQREACAAWAFVLIAEFWGMTYQNILVGYTILPMNKLIITKHCAQCLVIINLISEICTT